MVEHTLALSGEVAVAGDNARQRALLRRGPIPRHMAIIMDGNGRWAADRGYPRFHGHHKGVDSVRDVIEVCTQLGIDYLTLYTFSAENWIRPTAEVEALMRLLLRTVRAERKNFQEKNIRFQTIGEISRMPKKVQKEIQITVEMTANNTGMTLVLALSYSGRWDIVEAVRYIVSKVEDGHLDSRDINETVVAQALNTRGIPDPDLLIRTGGEYRVSNFLLWQLAYTEMVITDCYWPAFRREQLYAAIRAYQNRERRFGGVKQ